MVSVAVRERVVVCECVGVRDRVGVAVADFVGVRVAVAVFVCVSEAVADLGDVADGVADAHCGSSASSKWTEPSGTSAARLHHALSATSASSPA